MDLFKTASVKSEEIREQLATESKVKIWKEGARIIEGHKWPYWKTAYCWRKCWIINLHDVVHGKLYKDIERTYRIHSPTNALLLIKKKKIKIYIKMHINIAPTCFVLRPSSGSLQ